MIFAQLFIKYKGQSTLYYISVKKKHSKKKTIKQKKHSEKKKQSGQSTLNYISVTKKKNNNVAIFFL